MGLLDQMNTWEIVGEERYEPVYRIPERETQKVKATAQKGDLVTYKRIVARVGYEFGVHSVTKREWAEAGLKIIAQETSLSIEDVEKVIVGLDLKSPFKGMKHQIYEALIHPLITKSGSKNIRAMWFYDYASNHVGHVDAIVRRLTGVRSPGGRSGYYGEENYPPYLADPVSHHLYRVTDHDGGRRVLVHPLDVVAR